ncbi:hypothetical protein TNCV_3997291 [Trichonephila clavipes]|nr:hypothetical protein TNCV_3997291 [Trichonephila clavipes]
MADVGIGPLSSSSCSERDTFRCVSWCSSIKNFLEFFYRQFISCPIMGSSMSSSFTSNFRSLAVVKMKRERGEEEQISSSINHIRNLTLLTSSKYNELNWQITLSKWTKTAPLKKSSMPNQFAHEKKAGQMLEGLMAWKKDLLVLRTKKWRTLARRRLAFKRLLEKAKAHSGLSSRRGRTLYIERRIMNEFFP